MVFLVVSIEDDTGKIVSAPSSKDIIATKAIYVIVNEGRGKTNSEIEQILKAS